MRRSLAALRALAGTGVRLEVLGGGRSGRGTVLAQAGELVELVVFGGGERALVAFAVGGALLQLSAPSIAAAWEEGGGAIYLRLAGGGAIAIGSDEREAGDVIAAGLPPERLVTLADLVAGADIPRDRPRLFKSTGMSWEDAVIASALTSR
jgi:hypothetical protein